MSVICNDPAEFLRSVPGGPKQKRKKAGAEEKICLPGGTALEGAQEGTGRTINSKGCIIGKISVETCEIEGLKIITPAVFGDERGYFYESYHYEAYKEAGIPEEQILNLSYRRFRDWLAARKHIDDLPEE